MAFLKDLLSPGPGSLDEFSQEWQDAFGIFESPGATSALSSGTAAVEAASSSGRPETVVAAAEARPQSNSPSPTGFLPSHLLDHSLSSTGLLYCSLLVEYVHCM